MIPLKTVNDLINKHALLEKELSSTEIDKNSFAEKSKEYPELNEIIKIAKFYISFEKDKKEIQSNSSNDEETGSVQFAKRRAEKLRAKEEKARKQLEQEQMQSTVADDLPEHDWLVE